MSVSRCWDTTIVGEELKWRMRKRTGASGIGGATAVRSVDTDCGRACASAGIKGTYTSLSSTDEQEIRCRPYMLL